MNLGRFLQMHIAKIMNAYLPPSLVPHTALDRYLRQYFLSNKAIGSHDRYVISEKVYGLIRYQLLLRHVMKGQISYQDQIKVLNSSDFFNAMENASLPKFDLHLKQTPEDIISQNSLLSYLIQLWIGVILRNLQGAQLQSSAHHSCQPDQVLEEQCNHLGTQVLRMLRNYLKLQAIETQFSPYGICINGRPTSLYETKQFLDGHYQVQDEGSQLAADMIDCQPGDLVLDFCAGSGGKSLTIAHKLRGRGQIFLHDIRENALLKAKRRFEKSGVTNIQFHSTEDKLRQMHCKMDWVVVDAPCTGTGTIRRNPDLKYRFSHDWLKENVLLQEQILHRSIRYLNKSGKLLYITCSLLKQENQQQVSRIISKYNMKVLNNNFLRIKPAKNGMDGMFAVVLQSNH